MIYILVGFIISNAEQPGARKSILTNRTPLFVVSISIYGLAYVCGPHFSAGELNNFSKVLSYPKVSLRGTQLTCTKISSIINLPKETKDRKPEVVYLHKMTFVYTVFFIEWEACKDFLRDIRFPSRSQIEVHVFHRKDADQKPTSQLDSR
ncbi:hypothetical protein OS493_010250 [Desmophyllum pertusum]|uniref:Uncharacterized protein n=1 Tax=Desmophyllum pertusum TaxID=174260 RepID=A0A9X0A4E9_9CNID|nr:hypothetical protein OS493_010250 [Desmophyllum pertusum]